MSLPSDFELIFIIGPPASSKMTVGQELAKLTTYKLFHNHMSLELVNRFFDFGTKSFSQLDREIRFSIYRSIAESDLPGMIFTLVMDFDDPRDTAYLDEITEIFALRNLRTYILELDCELEERLRRNKTENRLKHKASKRNIAFSESLLLKEHERYRTNSKPGELSQYILYKIDNTKLSANDTAKEFFHKLGIDKNT